MFEYMSFGKPIICSDMPVLHEVLKNKETAIMVDPEDIEAWISGIKELTDNPELAKSIAQNAKVAFETKYTWNARAKRVVEGLARE